MEERGDDKTIQQKIAGTDTPYYHVGKPGLLSGIKIGVARAIAPINPFAKVGVETTNRISWAPYENGFYHTPSPLPNPVTESNFLP